MIHSIRWLGPLIFSAAAALVVTGAAAQSSNGAPRTGSQAPRDSAAADADAPAAESDADAEADFDRHPQDCVTITNIKQTAIVDDSTILFYMRGGKKDTYRVSLPHACPNLASENRFGYKTTMNRLCSSDLITVLEQYGAGLRDGFTCRLGKFYPIPYEEAELLRKEHDKPGSTRGGMKTKPAEVAPEPPAASAPTPPSEPAPAEPGRDADSAPR